MLGLVCKSVEVAFAAALDDSCGAVLKHNSMLDQLLGGPSKLDSVENIFILLQPRFDRQFGNVKLHPIRVVKA